jgi:hypothetical protein
MAAVMQIDMWSGIFDNRASGCREVYTDGRLRRYARRNCCGVPNPTFTELGRPWGDFPDVPAHLNAHDKEQAE